MPLIAVIDDRVTNRSILTKLATSLGEDVTVRAFGDPKAALEWAADHCPDLVITDYKMPKLDGAEFVRHFRKLPLCFDVPVIVITVYEDRDFRYKALEAGATDFLISPVDHHEFRTRVRLSRVIDTVPAMVCATDAAGRCAFINNYMSAFFGVDARDAAGRPIGELFG